MIDKNRKVIDLLQDLVRHENEMKEYLKDIEDLTDEAKSFLISKNQISDIILEGAPSIRFNESFQDI